MCGLYIYLGCSNFYDRCISKGFWRCCKSCCCGRRYSFCAFYVSLRCFWCLSCFSCVYNLFNEYVSCRFCEDCSDLFCSFANFRYRSAPRRCWSCRCFRRLRVLLYSARSLLWIWSEAPLQEAHPEGTKCFLKRLRCRKTQLCKINYISIGRELITLLSTIFKKISNSVSMLCKARFELEPSCAFRARKRSTSFKISRFQR